MPVQAIVRIFALSKSPTVTIAGGIGAKSAPGARLFLFFFIIYPLFFSSIPSQR